MSLCSSSVIVSLKNWDWSSRSPPSEEQVDYLAPPKAKKSRPDSSRFLRRRSVRSSEVSRRSVIPEREDSLWLAITGSPFSHGSVRPHCVRRGCKSSRYQGPPHPPAQPTRVLTTSRRRTRWTALKALLSNFTFVYIRPAA